MSDDEDETRETDAVPTSGGKLPDNLLALRTVGESAFEHESSRARIAAAASWVRPLLIRVKVAVMLGADVSDDDQFSALVDEVYNGIRNRLTRQDLIVYMLDRVGETVDEEANLLVGQAMRELNALDTRWGVRRLTEPKNSADPM